MHTANIPPVDPAPATITAVLAMHAGHIFTSSEFLIRQRPLNQALLVRGRCFYERSKLALERLDRTAVPALCDGS